ncbi:hypothetical protein GM658_01145 [Pseudoduganella eburnea]|uniref:Uncharacterized protein n=1 Tax=Massilia eburnea TaxID=1776165 RepID=A0A6L6QAG2_9BURK|nr:hypothetical protein [Massilia eburnea]MTW09195.1 hypothetical protein [Massilia eburnea]
MQSTLRQIAALIGWLMNAYDRVSAVMGLAELMGTVQSVFGGASGIPTDYTGRSLGLAGINFGDAMESAAFNLPRAIGTGIGDWASGYAVSREKGKKLTGALVYMPLVTGGMLGNGKPLAVIPTPAKVRFGPERGPVKLVFGGPVGADGQLSGIGLEMGITRQLVRMDYHPFNAGHGGAAGVQTGEIAVWRDGSFHYHVRRWNQ